MTERFPQSGIKHDSALSEGTAKAAWRQTNTQEASNNLKFVGEGKEMTCLPH